MARWRRRRADRWSTPRNTKRPPPESSREVAAAAPAPLVPGAEVEVRVDDDGFHGSWFEATVVSFSPARGRRFPARYTVTYSHLLAEDGGVLTERFPASHTRPRPPPPPPFSLRLHDVVEAFHNDGWWSGIVVDPGETVTVAFPITREVISFRPDLVRPRRDYIAGEWVPSRTVIAVQPKHAVMEYKVGDKVEVGKDRDLFGHSWFPATVAKVVDPLSYIVEYIDLEVEGDVGTEKTTEFLHWRFIRPAVEHEPRESEFQLGPAAAVEAYCDGAWSPGIVRWAVGDGEYEVSIDGKKGEVLVTKVVALLKPLYNWNGKRWRIVGVKRQANLRRRSFSGRSPSSPVDVASSGDEHSHDHGSCAVKKSRCATERPRKDPQQQELILADGLVDVSISKMDNNLSTLCKSPERNHSPCVYSPLSGNNNLEVLPDSIGQTMVNQEILSEVLLDSQLNTPTCGTDAGNVCDNLRSKEVICASIASVVCQASSTLDEQRQTNLRQQSMSGRSLNAPFDVALSGDGHNHDCVSSGTKNLSARKRPRKEPQQQDLIVGEGLVDVSISEMDIPLSTLCKSPERDHSLCASARINSAGQQTSERMVSVKSLKMKKDIPNSEKTHSVQQLHGKQDASDNSGLMKDGNLCPKEIICALTASVDCQTKQVSRQTRSGLNSKVPMYKKSAKKKQSKELSKKKRSKELSNPYSPLDVVVESTFQHRGKENSMGSLKSCTQQDLDRSTEDAYQEQSPLIPPGFESIYRAGGFSRHNSLLDEELASGICQANRNGNVPTDLAAIQGAKYSQLMNTPMLSLDHRTQQGAENHQNAGSPPSTVVNSKLRRCSIVSNLTSPISGHPVVPFVRASSLWHAVEASNVFKLVPQQPHFLPLKKLPLEMREGLALGLMVTFTTLVQSISEANIEECMDMFEDKVNTLYHLESNGFNVQFLQNKLTKMLQIKSDCSEYVGEINKLETGMVEKTTSLSRMDALLNENDEAIGKLEQQLAHLREEANKITKNRESENAELLRLKSERSRFEEAYAERERQFQTLLVDLPRERLTVSDALG